MKNRNVGYLISAIGLVIILIIIIFNVGMREIVSSSCDHGLTCPMYGVIRTQTLFSLAIAGLVLIIGLFFIFAKENEKIVVKTRTVKLKRKPISIKNLDKQEKQVIQELQKENGAIFQKDLMERLNIGKVGITRLLDRLESKNLVERKRRGMNNIVVLKQ